MSNHVGRERAFVSNFRLRNTPHTLCRTKFEYRWINSLEIEVHLNYTLDYSLYLAESKIHPHFKGHLVNAVTGLIAACRENNMKHANALCGILHEVVHVVTSEL